MIACHKCQRADFVTRTVLEGVFFLGSGERVETGSAIFEQSRFVGTEAPAEQSALMDRMERVDKNQGATERQSGRDATPAESDTMSVSQVPARPALFSHAIR